jgi:hypothetical protein
MRAEPKNQSEMEPVRRDRVSVIVAITLAALGAGGILSVFSGPLFALFTHSSSAP